MLTELCAELNNYFLTHKDADVHCGVYSIVDGTLNLTEQGIIPGQYFRIVGSRLNDGVYQYPVTDLSDETFDGAIWAMSVPPSFIALAEEIAGWVEANGAALAGPYTSESFAGYSYSKASTRSGAGAYGWQDQFATRLNPYRRLPGI